MMLTWAEILLMLLKVVNTIMGAVNQDKWIKAGTDAEIAKVSASILAKTEAGKKIMEKINAMSNEDVDIGLRGLEPK